MVTGDEVRRIALALPEAVEQDHHGRPSFRVGGKIFATLWDDRHLNVMLDEPGSSPPCRPGRACAPSAGGGSAWPRSRSTSRASAELMAELLADAFEHKAPRRLVDKRPAG